MVKMRFDSSILLLSHVYKIHVLMWSVALQCYHVGALDVEQNGCVAMLDLVLQL